jgi:hypothetical protein
MAKCKRKRIVIKKGRKVIAEFMGHQGSGCPPRKKPSTSHLSLWKRTMREEAGPCKRKAKGNAAVYRRCIGNAMRSVTPR